MIKKLIAGIFSASISFNAFADVSQHDPYKIANESKTEYTEYLKNLFEQSPSMKVEKVSASAQIKKNSTSYKFRTEIKRQSKLKVANFAEDWIITVIGCGTGCNQYFLTNVKTGHVVDPKLMSTNGTPLFVKNKNLLATAGSINEKTLSDAQKGVFGGPKFWIWKNNKFTEKIF